MLVYAIVDDSLSLTSPLGDAVETFIGRDNAERFIEDVRGDEPELALLDAQVLRELVTGELELLIEWPSRRM